MVTARVYHDTRKFCEGYSGNWSLYFPVPRNFQSRDDGNGQYVSCNIDNEEGKISFCEWGTHDYYKGGVNSDSFYLGKKIKRETLHPHIQEVINKYEALWNNVWKHYGKHDAEYEKAAEEWVQTDFN